MAFSSFNLLQQYSVLSQNGRHLDIQFQNKLLKYLMFILIHQPETQISMISLLIEKAPTRGSGGKAFNEQSESNCCKATSNQHYGQVNNIACLHGIHTYIT